MEFQAICTSYACEEGMGSEESVEYALGLSTIPEVECQPPANTGGTPDGAAQSTTEGKKSRQKMRIGFRPRNDNALHFQSTLTTHIAY